MSLPTRWNESPRHDDRQFLLNWNELEEIVQMVVNEAHSGDRMDMPVLWFKIERDVLSSNEVDF